MKVKTSPYERAINFLSSAVERVREAGALADELEVRVREDMKTERDLRARLAAVEQERDEALVGKEMAYRAGELTTGEQRERAEKADASCAALRETVTDLLRAAEGFMEAVRSDTGTPYPWAPWEHESDGARALLAAENPGANYVPRELLTKVGAAESALKAEQARVNTLSAIEAEVRRRLGQTESTLKAEQAAHAATKFERDRTIVIVDDLRANAEARERGLRAALENLHKYVLLTGKAFDGSRAEMIEARAALAATHEGEAT